MKKAAARFGKQVNMVNDNGSENMKDAQAYLASQGVTQYWTRPYSPKEKPFVERLIGTLQSRPQEALNFLTPAEFSAILGFSTPNAGRS
ncbi:MAG: hypothetical protein LBD29_07230 [Treponema sp.]|jgi:hypothetical protein|nr:hypothetical protein [Treponema sp.]